MAEPSELSPEEISERVKAIFGLKPCLWQIEAARAQLSGNDVIVIAPTGMGKTLAFQIPLCLDPDRILIIVSPLTTLSQQHAANLLERGISSFALCQGTVSSKALEVCLILTYSCGFDSSDTRTLPTVSIGPSSCRQRSSTLHDSERC
jgi:superfamily II DNA or RNA helicase